MEPDLLGVMTQAVVEAWEEEEEARAGWEVTGLEPDQVENAFAPLAEPDCPIG